MRLIIQRVTQASVTVSGSVVGAINKGYLVLVGIGQNDTCLLYTSDAADE